MLYLLFAYTYVGCTETSDLLVVEKQPVGIETETIVAIENELNSAYAHWENEEYDLAYTALTKLNLESMNSIWPILREEDASATLYLEVQLGKALWATERKRSIVNNDTARTLKSNLLKELNDIKIVEPIASEQSDQGGNPSAK